MGHDRQFPQGRRVDDLDLSSVHLHGARLEGARLTDADLRGADISGYIESLRVNDVGIEPLVRSELDRRFPERVMLRSTDVAGLRAAWSMLEDRWAATTERASGLSDELQMRRVDGEWSFVETLRHLIFATDCWFSRAIQLSRKSLPSMGSPVDGRRVRVGAGDRRRHLGEAAPRRGAASAARASARRRLPVREPRRPRAHRGSHSPR